MDEEFAEPRNVESDLADITSRLGEPEAMYRTNIRRVAWRFTLGVLFVAAAAGLHFSLWSGLVPWPRGAIFWKVLVVGMFVSPAAGLYLIYFAVSGMKLWVLTYPTGLFVWHRGRVFAFPWDEIAAFQISGLPDKAVLNQPPGLDGLPETVWFDLEKSRRRLFGTTIKLTRADGEQIRIMSTLDDFPDLGRRVQEETYRRLFPIKWAEFQEGRTLVFGVLSCHAGGITVGTKHLQWAEVDALVRVSDKLEVRKIKKKRPWVKCELKEIVNPHVLMGIASAARLAEGPDGPLR
jgi:hypothetical protein